MARGRQQHQARQAAVAGLGRALSRRSRSNCELCGEGGMLSVVEVAPAPEPPSEDAAVMLCERCADAVAGGRRAPPASELRFLEGSVWSDVAPAQILAVRLARTLAAGGAQWAEELLAGLYLAPGIEVRIDAG
jgi:protein PhnA